LSSDNLPLGGTYINDFPLSKGFDIAHRWLAEEAAVFTIELTDTFVSDLKGNSGSIEAVKQHSSSRSLQP
jgi:hypothetical protein